MTHNPPPIGAAASGMPGMPSSAAANAARIQEARVNAMLATLQNQLQAALAQCVYLAADLAVRNEELALECELTADLSARLDALVEGSVPGVQVVDAAT